MSCAELVLAGHEHVGVQDRIVTQLNLHVVAERLARRVVEVVAKMAHEVGHNPAVPAVGAAAACYRCAYEVGGSRIMEVAIRQMGNSQGVLIPKPILAQLGLHGAADLQARSKASGV